MTEFVPIVMFGWIPVVMGIYVLLPPRHAVVASYLAGWLFLPIAVYPLPGLPDYTKVSATTVAIFLAMAVFDMGRIVSFRFRWFDLPIAVYCLTPMATSLSNGLGWYDGMSGSVERVIMWGLPYLVGRLYFRNLSELRELAVGLFIGGLIYLPLCLWEIRMSPQLHYWVYGYHQHDWLATMRLGGWRPTVFMQHGLAVGTWMTITALIGLWLWMSGSVRRLWGLPIGWLALATLATAVLCKSSLALILLAAGLLLLLLVRWRPRKWVMVALVAAAPLYMTLRVTEVWSGPQAAMQVKDLLSGDRARSLRHRLYSEGPFINRAKHRPVFGWGGYGRFMPERSDYEYWDDDLGAAIPDAMWTGTFGVNGFVGLASWTTLMLLPALRFSRRVDPKRWTDPRIAPAFGIAMVIGLYMLDCLMNAMINPLFIMMIGALNCAISKPVPPPQPARRAVARRPRPNAGVRGGRPHPQINYPS